MNKGTGLTRFIHGIERKRRGGGRGTRQGRGGRGGREGRDGTGGGRAQR